MHYGKPDKKKEWRSCRKLEKSTMFGGSSLEKHTLSKTIQRKGKAQPR